MAKPEPKPPIYEVVRMTPALASSWLARPWARQRRLSQAAVNRYAQAMAEGRWHEPSLDPIALTSDDHLLNGQHRLAAVIDAAWTGDMLVARNVDPDQFAVIDTGRRRAAGQFVETPSGDAVAAVARMALWYAERWPAPPRGRSLTFDNDTLLGYIDANATGLLQAVRDAHAAAAAGLPRGTGAPLLYLARSLGADEARLLDFMDGVARGANLDGNDPRLQLRNRLNGPQGAVLRRDSSAVWMLAVRAFNAWYQGRTLDKLPLDRKEDPPRIDLTGREADRVAQAKAKARRRAGQNQPAKPDRLTAVQ